MSAPSKEAIPASVLALWRQVSTWSDERIAERLGVTKPTLYKWIGAGKCAEPAPDPARHDVRGRLSSMRDAALAALSAVLEDDNASPAARVRAAEMVLRPSGALEPAPPPFTPPPAAPIPTTKLEEAESRYRELTRIVDTLTGNPAALVAAIEHRARAYADVLAARAEEGQAVPAERELSTLLDELGTAPTAVQEAVLQHLAGILRVELRPL